MAAIRHYLDFEKPIAELEGKTEELRHLMGNDDFNIAEEVQKLEAKTQKLLRATYEKLTPWQKALVARHPERPHSKDYIDQLFTDFTPLAGDRLYGEDKAIIGGLGRFRGQSCVILGQEKGHDMSTRVTHNFGMPRPEGYRKAQRLMQLAERFRLPLITFIDTPGAYPGIDAEERGQAEAIARSMEVSFTLGCPIIAIVIGEGGSGGAIALATANRVLMLEHAIYSVISPEGCASILWRSATHNKDAAEALRLTAKDLKDFNVIDKIVKEPLGGAHRKRLEALDMVGTAIGAALGELKSYEPAALKSQRREKFLAMGR